jgi:uncharacterized protein YdcH (DUF465 family)
MFTDNIETVINPINQDLHNLKKDWAKFVQIFREKSTDLNEFIKKIYSNTDTGSASIGNLESAAI